MHRLGNKSVMSRQHIKRTFLVGVNLVLAVAVTAAESTGDGASSNHTLEGAVLDWSHALQAHAWVEQWVAAGSTDQSASLPSIRVADAIATRVTLRWSGLTVATGRALAPLSNELRRQSIDLKLLVKAATDEALQIAAQRLDNHHRQHRLVDGKPNTNGLGTLATAANRLQVSLQIARPLQRITMANEDPLRAIYHHFIPGYHGLRLTHRTRHDPQPAAWIWPANALAANMSPRDQLLRLLVDLGYGINDLPLVARQKGPRLERFEVIHVVRSGPDLPVMRLVRGCQEIPLSSLSAAYIESMAERMSDFLIRRLRPDGSMAGIYHPSTDRYDLAEASDEDLAWAAYALGSRVKNLLQLKVKHPQLSQCRKAVGLIVDRLTRRILNAAKIDDSLVIDATTASLLLMTLIDLTNPAPYKAVSGALAKHLLLLRNSDGSFRRGPNERSPLLSRATAALVTAALSHLHEKNRDPQLAVQIADSQNQIWNHSDAKGLFEALPWLVVTEMQGHHSTTRGMNDEHDSKVNRTLDQLILALRHRHAGGLLRTNQLSATLVANKSFGPMAEPSWRAADLILVLSSILENRDFLQQRDTSQLLLACAVAARSLGWLMFNESSCYYVRSQSDVLGGVRKNLWDNRLGGVATATSLLAITQLQATMTRLNRKWLSKDSGSKTR